MVKRLILLLSVSLAALGLAAEDNAVLSLSLPEVLARARKNSVDAEVDRKSVV